jgi:hypothetical protein
MKKEKGISQGRPVEDSFKKWPVLKGGNFWGRSRKEQLLRKVLIVVASRNTLLVGLLKKSLIRGLFKEGTLVGHVLKVAPFSLPFLISAVTIRTVVYPVPIGHLPIEPTHIQT